MDTLRARNKVLTDALQHIQETAKAEIQHKYDLVWFARNRSRYPNHTSRKRIEQSEQHQEELEKLKTPEADFYHGMHTGLLAAARLFQQQADILHILDNDKNDESGVEQHTMTHEDLLQESSKHAKSHLQPSEK